MYYKKFIYNGSQILASRRWVGFGLSVQEANTPKKEFLAVKL